jgi:hypothetical protein
MSTSSISSEQEKGVECMEKISSVFILVVLIDEENFSLFFLMEWDTFSVFVNELVFHRGSDFFRKRLSLCFSRKDHKNTHQDNLFGNKMIS